MILSECRVNLGVVWEKMQRSCKRGFTLVEVIVVLVILAILAAIMIPAMTGWIDRAREKAAIAGCRTCVAAAQTIASEQYAEGVVYVTEAQVLELARVNGTVDGVDVVTPAVVDALTYTDPNSITVTYLRRPQPHYEVGMASASVAFNALKNAFERVRQGGDLKILSNGQYVSFNGTKIDGVNSGKDNMFAKAMFDTLTPAQQNFLSGVSWSIVKENNTFNLYFTEQHYGADSGTHTDLKVYQYDWITKKYCYAQDGTTVNGEVKPGTTWSEWSDTMD